MAASPVVFGRAKYLNANTLLHGAWDLRPSQYGVPPGPGVAGYEDFRVIQRQAGANMSVDVGTTAQTALGMAAWVRGSTRGHQGLYECTTVDWGAATTDTYVAQLNIDVTANASGNPRLDMVVLEILDAQHTGSSSVMQLRMVNGTATGGATLDNRTGAAALPASCILLADILVPNGAASIVTADIRDRRSSAVWGALPVLAGVGSSVNQVAFMPAHGLQVSNVQVSAQTNMDLFQSAALMFLPRRIVSATRVRWRYQQGATANAGNWIIGIYDATGRNIVSTAATAYVGGANTYTEATTTIAATTFEAGWYWVAIGNSAATAASTVVAVSVFGTLANAGGPGVPYRNIMVRVGSGGTTLPTTLLGMTDVGALGAATVSPAVPLIALSVG